ncbi:transglutaminase-like domain-containing protein [Microbacterium dauci]|uniref:Transglutaminase domain-containing protein n=1 Tax=Microbacterium dauci TaxID=3048008 RepID=A0ABT6ZA42_9MICO|nr:transglutaminase domain-containing protein [Microbacterium sp. LX3-4]MDJ1113022.1 transglutaminase domain-containing protein [Microbacterium sp. LX3-4]
MQRLVRAELDLDIEGSLDLILAVAVSSVTPLRAESFTIESDAGALQPDEVGDLVGTRLHRLRVEPGPVRVRYQATVETGAPPLDADGLQTAVFLRPSRYAPSDAVFGHARRQFGGLRGAELLTAVEQYVFDSVTYSPGLSQGTDSALTTLSTGQGVCRDYAHLVIALLRAMDVPARYVACYAPGLVPMDFHAVAEAWLDGAWRVLDATRLANRHGLIRIATGRDAADCAFLSYYGGNLALQRMVVDAVVEGDTGVIAAASDPLMDDRTALVTIG